MQFAKVTAGMLAKWQKERDEVVKTYDVEKFRNFYRKYQILGVYPAEFNLPKDESIQITMHKMVYHMRYATPKEKADAAKWLKDHGISLN